MKTRNGFVSNSSSSSFIIPVGKKFPNVRSLAKYMIKQKIKEDFFDEDDEEEKKSYTIFNKNLIKRLENVTVNEPVSFSSCNYDTYIKKVGNFFFVATCNNTDWNLDEYHNSYVDDETIKELKKLKETYRESTNSRKQIKYILKNILKGGYLEFYNFGKDYYDLDNELVGVQTYDDCPKCGQNLWKSVKYGKFCLKCSPYHKRKDKLIEITKNFS